MVTNTFPSSTTGDRMGKSRSAVPYYQWLQ
jgi:hypothetical protein